MKSLRNTLDRAKELLENYPCTVAVYWGDSGKPVVRIEIEPNVDASSAAIKSRLLEFGESIEILVNKVHSERHAQ